ncbi:hypothetical protein XCR1_940022 [Xenorhabdus cabanillasii JM26]|nr:hypothetical protein XCR1_940022 [Xenorhabdus cabanillasii JM26]
MISLFMSKIIFIILISIYKYYIMMVITDCYQVIIIYHYTFKLDIYNLKIIINLTNI